jgi:hypothetical protein
VEVHVLKSVRLSGFKSYREAELPLSPLTVLIGANASGKSNALEGLRLLSWIAQGNRLGNLRQITGGPIVRGRVDSLGYNGGQAFHLGCVVDGIGWDRFDIGLRVGADGDVHVEEEKITGHSSKVPLYETVGKVDDHGNDLRVAYNNFARGGKKPQVICNDGVAVLQQLESAARFEAGHRHAQAIIPEVCEHVRAVLTAILFLDPQPVTMRGYSHKSEYRLNGDGSNLSGVIYHLTEAEGDKVRARYSQPGFGPGLSASDMYPTPLPPLITDRQRRDAILNLVRSLPEQNIEALAFIETPRQEVMLTLRETFGGKARDYDATILSDGTLRVLAIAAAVLSAPPGSLVVIEEIDNGIHPSRAEEILRGIADIAKARRLSVLISSHNPALLDALPDEAVPDVVFCYRDPQDGSSRLVRLETLPDYPELIAQGTLGHLLTSGLIDRFVKTHPGSIIKKRRAEEWLQRLRVEVE